MASHFSIIHIKLCPLNFCEELCWNSRWKLFFSLQISVRKLPPTEINLSNKHLSISESRKILILQCVWIMCYQCTNSIPFLLLPGVLMAWSQHKLNLIWKPFWRADEQTIDVPATWRCSDWETNRMRLWKEWDKKKKRRTEGKSDCSTSSVRLGLFLTR